MFDVTSELIAIRKQREQDFISISELLEFIKKHNPQAFYSEIATLLLIKLEPHDIRKTDDQLWGDEAFEYWESEHGIKTYIITEDISNKPQSICGSEFFSALEEIKTDKQALIFDDTCTAKDYLTDYQNNIFIDRKQIENILGISTLDKEALNNKYQNEIKLAVGMALTRTEEFVRNTDINKSPVGLAERLVMLQQIAELHAHIAELEQANSTIQAKDEQIAELEKQLEQAKRAESAVKSDDVLTQPKQGRISQPQRDLFSLLVLKNYQDYQSRNALFDAINADMKEHGIRTSDIKYPTLDNLIDDNLRINGLSIFPSKFPSKQK
ncbi:hypothetical protein HSM_1675 [Histophilus somni 2336]|uniref:hypothetical protein n=1 Tax=Histophilus somni TaxID=731 RepID=UPI000045D697|nr:hypothetical protein [Histophilus somni]ACA31446.1 hypothetical protein HSM_1675 [Histophilus somni 2336]